jgi:hypothetical protein
VEQQQQTTKQKIGVADGVKPQHKNKNKNTKNTTK